MFKLMPPYVPLVAAIAFAVATICLMWHGEHNARIRAERALLERVKHDDELRAALFNYGVALGRNVAWQLAAKQDYAHSSHAEDLMVLEKLRADGDPGTWLEIYAKQVEALKNTP